MTLSKKPYRGTRDFFPTDKRKRDYLFSAMSNTAELFGYESYDGPLLEEVDLYRAKSGEELINEQIYSFTDRGEREVAIRPEMTPTLARMVAQIHKVETKPIRWYAIPNLMRYEKPQRGRLREHWQFNVDIFGAPEHAGEIEILQVAVSLMKKLGATEQHFEILLNDRRVVDALFKQAMGANDEQALKLYKIVDAAKKIGAEGVAKKVAELSLAANSLEIFNKYLALTSFDGLIELLKEYKQDEASQSLLKFTEKLGLMNLSSYVKFDPAVVRGLDYYTGVVFEIFDKHPDNRRALCGGGAYANLLKIFNEEPVAGIGFGLGDVTMTDFLETHGLMPNFEVANNDLLIAALDEESLTKSQLLAQELRDNGVKVICGLEPIKLKKAFPMAEKKGASFVAFIGNNEIQNQIIPIKNLKEKSQQEFKMTDIETIAKHLLSEG